MVDNFPVYIEPPNCVYVNGNKRMYCVGRRSEKELEVSEIYPEEHEIFYFTPGMRCKDVALFG